MMTGFNMSTPRYKFRFIKEDGTIQGGWIVLFLNLVVFGIFIAAAVSSKVSANIDSWVGEMVLALTVVNGGFFASRGYSKKLKNGNNQEI